MSVIEVNYAYLENVAANARRVADSLRDNTAIGGASLGSAPPVREALAQLERDWDMRRHELSDVIEALASSLDNARASFEESDAALANQLTDGAGSK